MRGNKRFFLDLSERSYFVSLTEQASRESGISYIMDTDREEGDKILSS
jgi:hypothetical protein